MDDRHRDVALFRYSLIREAADPALTKAQRGGLVRALAARDHTGPKGERVRVARQHRPAPEHQPTPTSPPRRAPPHHTDPFHHTPPRNEAPTSDHPDRVGGFRLSGYWRIVCAGAQLVS